MCLERIRKIANTQSQLYKIQTRADNHCRVRNSGKSPENENGSLCGSRQSSFFPFPSPPKIGEQSGPRNIDF